MNLSETAEKELRDYLDYHEYDIAVGLEDFDNIRALFKEVMGRDAQPPKSQRWFDR